MVNIKTNSYGKFELLKSHLVEKIINDDGLEVSSSLKAREKPSEKLLLNKRLIKSRNKVCMELKDSGWYVQLSSGVSTTRNINVHTLVRTFWQ